MNQWEEESINDLQNPLNIRCELIKSKINRDKFKNIGLN